MRAVRPSTVDYLCPRQISQRAPNQRALSAFLSKECCFCWMATPAGTDVEGEGPPCMVAAASRLSELNHALA